MRRVLLVTSWGPDVQCGICEHSKLLIEFAHAADPTIEILPSSDALEPARARDLLPGNILHLNYHRALHSRWTPYAVEWAKTEFHVPVIITFHDTYGEHPPDDLTVALARLADAFIVHEPCVGLPKAIYWRMGVPDPETPYLVHPMKRWHEQPVLASIGFPFPWKNFDQLCDVTRRAGWALLLIAPGATTEQTQEWYRRQPDLFVVPGFIPQREAIQMLSAADASAFMYVCGNSGQSAAMLQGIAARKPVIALSSCRQFRALHEDPLGRLAITWVQNFEQLQSALALMSDSVCSRMIALAEQESWAKLGVKYADLYHELDLP